VVIYPDTPSPAARSISFRKPQEAFDVSNADPAVRDYVAKTNVMIEKFNKGWRPSISEIIERQKTQYVGSLLFSELHVSEDLADTDRQAINNAFLTAAAEQSKIIDTSTTDAQTATAERAGQHPYFLVALAILNDVGRQRTLPGITPVARIKPPQAREGCDAQLKLANRSHFLVSTNPYVKVRYACWTETKFMAVSSALMRCNHFGVGCDRLQF
jgi:hypothetical protein